ncbi:hypothetical protein ACLMJK_000746 [Lecanora helva]
MSNRKTRRAQARSKHADGAEDEVPLRQPLRESPRGKTLLDIANERQLINRSSSTNPTITSTKINPDGSLSAPEIIEGPSDSTATPYLDIALYTSSLTFFHYTLTVLVHHQYGEGPPSLPQLFYESTIASPTPALILILLGILHPRSSQILVQLLFATISLVAGAWLVHASNEDQYMAVMKKAPPLGTLWVWTVIEMRWEWAVGSLGLVAGWGWWKGYTVY